MSPVQIARRTLGRTLGSFHPRAVPVLSRAYYRRELAAWTLLPIMMGAVEGGVVSVIAKIAFAGTVPERALNVVVAILAGAPAFANVTSFVWATLSHGRHKIRFLTGLQLAAVVLVAQVAFAPPDAIGLAMLTLAAVGARVCWSGVVTLRATVWRANYPRRVRASMAGKLATVQAIVLAAVGLAIGLAMRADGQSFHLLFPLAAGGGFAGALVFNRMRMRGHAALRRQERASAAEAAAAGVGLGRSWRILRSDALFRRYMIAMFVFGIGNLMVGAPLVVVLRDVFGFGYLGGILIMSTIPIMLMPVSIPMWSRFLDRVHVIRFRVIHCWSFVAATAAVLAATVVDPPSLAWMLWVAAALKGIAIGGGVLGWNLGHHDFAPRELASQYMGVHVTLTGIRGLIGPPLAIGLYEWFNAARPGAGGWVFGVCLGLNLVGAVGFARLDRRRCRAADDDDFPASPRP